MEFSILECNEFLTMGRCYFECSLLVAINELLSIARNRNVMLRHQISKMDVIWQSMREFNILMYSTPLILGKDELGCSFKLTELSGIRAIGTGGAKGACVPPRL